MQPQTIIFFGRSGSGKGTQAKLLLDFLNQKDTEHKTLYVETGAKLREFMEQVYPTSKEVKNIIASGGLLPEFLPIWIWTDFFVKNVSGSEHLILDGLSRRVEEAPVLDSAMRFYKRESPHIVHINVTASWATDRLLSRGRADDNNLDIKKRMDWYDTNVLPTLEYFKKNNDYYKFHDINGEQTIEEVHSDLMKELGL